LNSLLEKTADVTSLSPLTLAFMGDTVFDLLVRSELICEANRPVKDLHSTASKKVCAKAQADGIKKIMPLLTEDELAVFKRGRNAHTGAIPKHASSADYHYATGLESLFGWLYLKGETERIRILFNAIKETDEEVKYE
jgi:ribonuclease-3 family protein